MKLLLINPKFHESFWSLRFAIDELLSNKRTVNPPLGLATLAALCPEDWEVEIIDENIESIPLDPQADIIGVCGMGVQFNRQKELLTFYKGKGFFTVAGGSYASLCPEEYETYADTVVAGEAEYIWKEFCSDFEQGSPQKLYHETGEVSLEDSPAPRFDLLKLEKYQSVSMQFSRGCPFLCEFCDIIVMFGRKPRTKSMEQIGRELDLLREHNVHSAFFVDDNFIGNKPQAKKLLAFLRDYQRKHNYWFHFGTEASLNLAQDDKLLRLFREANFGWVFIGIESPDEESLKETKKFQNTREDILTSVRHIYSYGIDILAGFIIGFDNDTTDTFDLQYRFITKSGIQGAMIGLLMAVPKTPLYERLEKEGRIIPEASSSDNTKLATNLIPKGMGYDEMVSGYRELYSRLLTDKNIAERIKNKTEYFTNPVTYRSYSFLQELKILRRFLVKGIAGGGLKRVMHFLLSLPYRRPRLMSMVIRDWIFGITMREYFDRYFIEQTEESEQMTPSYLRLIEKAFSRYLSRGALEVSLHQVKNTAANLSISLKGRLGSDFFDPIAHHLEKVLENTTSSVTLHIEEFHESQLMHLDKLLKRLSRYGDRINIRVHEKLRDMVVIDSSVFNLML